MSVLKIDVCIVGGGICGLFCADLLRKSGFSVVVVQRGRWGAGQSCFSQGIFHKGYKYLDKNVEHPLRRQLTRASALWHSYLLDPQNGFKLTSHDFRAVDYLFFDAMGQSCSEANLRDLGFTGKYQTSDEQQVPSAIIVEKLLARLPAGFATPRGALIDRCDGMLKVAVPDIDLQVEPKFIVLAAGGEGVTMFNRLTGLGLRSKCRPLTHVQMEGMPFSLTAHIFSDGSRPDVTVTSSIHGKYWTWDIGGAMTETSDQTVACDQTINRLKLFFPKLSVGRTSSHSVERHEVFDGSSDVASDFFIYHHDNITVCLPTKATLVPLLGAAVCDRIKSSIRPEFNQEFVRA
jgi:hypothetical protein